LFFAGQGQSLLANQARAICAVCEVQGEYLEFGSASLSNEVGSKRGRAPSRFLFARRTLFRKRADVRLRAAGSLRQHAPLGGD
jgi:hypothetical protein